MKLKINLLYLFMLVSWTYTKAQNYNYYGGHLYISFFNPSTEMSVKKYGIQRVSTQFYKGEKEKKDEASIREYSVSGDLLKIDYPGSHSTETYTWENNHMTSHLRTRKGDTLYYVVSTFDKEGNEISRISYRKSIHKIENNWKYSYGENHRLTKIERLNKKGETITRYENDYNEKGQRTESRYYKKGKLKRVTSFMCDAKGENRPASVEQSKICTHHTPNPDGTYTYVQDITVDGKIIKNIYTYNQDSNMIAFEKYNVKGKRILRSNLTYNDQKKLTLYTEYNARNRQTRKIEKFYNDRSLLAEEKIYHKKKSPYREVYTYTFFISEAE